MAQDIFEDLLASLSVEEMRQQRREYQGKIEAFEARVKALSALIDIRAAMDNRDGSGTPPATDDQEGDPLSDLMRKLERPSIAKSVVAIMETAPGKTWSTDELYSALEERGWLPGGKTPRNSLQATFSRLVRDRVIERGDGRGLYKLPAGHGRDGASLLDGGR